MPQKLGRTMTKGESATGGVAATTVTPSGIEIAYYPPPDRHYEIRADPLNTKFSADLPTEWKDAPGVTEVLDVLDKKALVWWGMKMGVDSTKVLLDKGYAIARMSTEEIVNALKREKLTVNHVRDKAGDRGKAVHDAFETWAKTGTMPDPEMFPGQEQGYVRGLVLFLNDVRPLPEAAEVMVGSLEHGFAGRYDARLRIPGACEVVRKITPKRTYKATLRPGVILADLKTSAHVYPAHHFQIEAYEGASIESGYGRSDHRGILRVSSEGRYEFVRSTATFDDFLAVKAVYDALKRMKGQK